MAVSAFKIRRLRRGEEEALFNFLDRAYATQPAKRCRELWAWQYADNPLLDSGDYPTWVCWDQGRIIGQRPMMPFMLQIGNRTLMARWAPDFITLHEYRGQGIGYRLMQAVLGESEVFVALNSSPSALRIYEKLDCAFVGHIPRFVRVCDARGLFTVRFGRDNWLTRILSSWANMLLRITVNRYKPSRRENLCIEEIGDFGPDFDSLWERVSGAYQVIARRDSDFLNWRYVQQPGDGPHIFAARRAGVLVGYIVVRLLGAPSRGVICDVLADPEDQPALDALIGAAVVYCEGRGAAAIDCPALHPDLERSLRRFGFRPRGPGVSFVVHAGQSGIDVGLLCQRRHWFVTRADSDLDPVFH